MEFPFHRSPHSPRGNRKAGRKQPSATQQQPQQQLKTKTKMLNAVCGIARCGTVKQNDRFFLQIGQEYISVSVRPVGLARRSDQATGSARWLTVNTPWVLMDLLCWICRFRRISDCH